MLYLIGLLSAILIFFIVNRLLLFALKGHVGMDERMQRYVLNKSVPKGNLNDKDNPNKSSDPESFSKKVIHLVRYIGKKIKKFPKTKIFDIKMQQAGFPLLGAEFIVVLTAIAVAIGLFTFIFTESIIQSICMIILTVILSLIYVNIKISRRRKAFDNQIGDALVMMSNAMRSGFSFMQSVDMVANEMSAPISSEFAKLVGEMRLGISTDDALKNINQRVGSKDFELVVIAVMIHRQVGGNLTQIFDSISETIAERIRMKNEIKTLTAQGRLSGWFVGLLPFALGLFMYINDPDYLNPLIHNKIGQMLIGFGLVSQLIGVLCIKKIINIKF